MELPKAAQHHLGPLSASESGPRWFQTGRPGGSSRPFLDPVALNHVADRESRLGVESGLEKVQSWACRLPESGLPESRL